MQGRLRYLFNQYLENKCSRNELEELFDLIRRADHDEAIREMIRETYGTLSKNAGTAAHVDENGQLILNETNWKAAANALPPKKRSRSLLLVTIIVLTIAVVAGVWMKTVPGLKKRSVMSSLTRKTTNRSETKYLLLQDSTRVWLNAASSIEFPDHFGAENREVFLKGEAYFEVVHADKVPFAIHTGDIVSKLTGTALNIKAYAGQKNIVISVGKGEVSIFRKNELASKLMKGQQLLIEEKGNGSIKKETAVDSIAGWRQEILNYTDERFSDVIADLERVYNVKISVEDIELGKRLVTASFKKEIGIEQVLNMMCRVTDSRWIRKDEVYYLK